MQQGIGQTQAAREPRGGFSTGYSDGFEVTI
jgi:hypothetical protein